MGYWDKPEMREKLRQAWQEHRKVDTKPKVKKTVKKQRVKPMNFCKFNQFYILCSNFKRNYKNQPKEVILSELRRLSKIEFANNVSYEERREKKHYINKNKKCFACGGKADIQHHIILINNGGYDNGINRVPLCNDCHKEIHPWMG